jgi:histidine triad (HIT) family protein
MRNNCIFCAIWDGEIPSEVISRTNTLLVFKDIHPQAPVHLLIIPKKHIRSIAELSKEDQLLAGEMLLQAKQSAEELSFAEDGYRVVFNTRHHGGQEVDHIHLHLLAGKPLGPLLPQ